MSKLKETEYGLIADDWKFIPSTKFCLKSTDGTHDSPKEQKTGKHLITSKHIKGRNIDFESADLISEADFNKINLRSKVEQWDVIISMIGEYCGFSFVERNKNIDYAVKNVGLFKTGSKSKAFWLYYFLNSKIGRFILDTNKSGTSQPYLTLGFLRELSILYPDKFEGTGTGKSDIEIETAIKQIVDEALSSDKVIDVFDAAGIDKPEISRLEILSNEFLLEVQGMQHKNLAIELLKKILNNELKSRAKTNLVKSRKLLEMLETAIKKYQNNLLSTAEIIQELINIARQIKEADKEGEKLGLTQDEVAFYNALEVNDSAVTVLDDDTRKEIAREIADKVRANASIDWTIRESARAKLMVLVKRTLAKWGYPPDKQQKAIETVLKQAELLADFLIKDK